MAESKRVEQPVKPEKDAFPEGFFITRMQTFVPVALEGRNRNGWLSEKEQLSLYGYIDGNWQVTVPPDQYVPLDLPEPAVGINFVRDSMPRKEWLALVAVHSDSWLLSVSFFYAAKCEFDMRSRSKLFELINSLPTLYQIVNRTVNKTWYCTSKVNKADPKSSNLTKVSQYPALAQRKEEVINDSTKRKRAKEEEDSDVPPLTQRKKEVINNTKGKKGAKENTT